MGVVMKVGAALDERAAQQVADRAERTFNDAGVRAGRGFGTNFQTQVESALNERVLDKSAAKIVAQMARTGKTGAEAMNAAIAAEASRTGQAADKIGEAITGRLGVHGQTAGQHFASMFMGELGNVAPGVSNTLSGVATVGRTAMEAVGGSAVAATAGVLGIGAAAVEAGRHLYEIGESFDNVAKRVEIQTGKMGSDLGGLTESIDQVAVHTASSLESIGAVAGSVSQAFHVTGEPLEQLTKQISDLDRMTGQALDVRSFGKLARQWGMDADTASKALDQLKVASENTGAPIEELIVDLNGLGPAARGLGMDFGQTANYIDAFDAAGLDAEATTKGMNRVIVEATKHHVDFKTVLGEAITEIQHFLAAGDTEGAQKLAQNIFGAKGAQQFIDAIRQGKLNVDDLNKSLDTAANAGHIEKLNDDTLRWADTWQIVKNRIEDALKPLAKPLFDGLQHGLRDIFGGGPDKPVPPLAPPPPGSGSTPLPAVPLPGQTPPGPGQPGFSPPAGKGVTPGDIFGHGAPGPSVGGPPAPFDPFHRDPNTIDAGPKPLPPVAPPPKQEWTGPPLSQTLQDDPDKKPKKPELPHVDVPYGPGYGAAPRAGETSQQYAAEQSLMEADQKRRQAQAQLSAVENTPGLSDDEKIKARNDLAKAEQEEYQAQLRLAEASKKTTGQLGDLGAKIDNDFGISKGIPGIVENLVKTLADAAAAPMLGQLSAYQQANEAATGIKGGYGLFGIMGAQNLSANRSPILGRPLDGGAPGVGTPGVSGIPGTGAGYSGDAALLSNVPAGRYDPSGDLSKGLGDCSSAVEDLVNIMDGRPTAGRGMSTGNAADWLPAHGFLPTTTPVPGSFQVGFNDHHMQATLPGGTPFNWGSDAAAANRGIGGSGAWDPAFTSHWYRPAGADAGGYGAGGTGLSGGAFAGASPGVVSVFVTNMPGAGVGIPGTGAAAPGGSPGSGGAPGGGSGDPGDITNPGLTPPGQTSFNNAPGAAPRADLAPSTPAPAAPNPLMPPPSPFAGDSPIAPTDTPSGFGGGAPGIKTAGFGTGGTPHPGTGAAPGPGNGPSKLGGVAPAANPQGGQAGITPGGSIDTALSLAAAAFPGGGQAAQLAIKETNRAIQYGSQVAGIAAGGIMEAVLPTGGSDLAQNSWLSKIMGGFAGARPAAPNLAGAAGDQNAKTPQKDPANPAGPGGAGGKGDTTNNVTINQASAQPANDVTHALTVQANSNPALGR